jgi:hypothetical protein
MRPVTATALVVAFALRAAAVEPPVVDWTRAGEHVGDIITVEGDVVAARSAGDTVTLDLAPDDARGFRVVLLIPLLSDLPPHPEELYAGRRVRASGRVERFQGRPEIVLNGPGQLAVVDVARTAPPSVVAAPATPPASAAHPAPATPPVAAAPRPAAVPVPSSPPAPVPSAAPPPPPSAPVPPAPAAPAPPPAAVAAPVVPSVVTSPTLAPPTTEPEPRGLAEAVQRRLAALDGCERARARWRDAGASARGRADALTQCLDGATYDCRAAAAALAPALSALEGAAQQVQAACP